MMVKRSALAMAVLLGLTGAAAADTLDRVRETGTLTIGFRQDAAPFSLQRQDGQAAGYTVDLCNAIADAVGEELEIDNFVVAYVPVTADNRFDALIDGDIDVLCGATTVTLSRRAVMDFSVLTFLSGASVLVAGESTIDSLEDMSGARIGVLGGTTTEAALYNTLEGSGIAAEVVTVDDRRDGLDALQAGEIDAFFGDRELLGGLLMSADEPGTLRLSSRYLTIEPYAVAFRLEDDALRLIADRTLSRLYRSGDIAPIFQRWFVGMEPTELLQALYILQALPH